MKLSWLCVAVLALNGLAFAGFGLAFAVRPDAMMALIDLNIPHEVARTDIRALYGGMELGLGLWLLLAAARPRLWEAGLLSGGLVTLGMVVARGLGMGVDGVDPTNPTLLIYELCASMLCWGALVVLRSAGTKASDRA